MSAEFWAEMDALKRKYFPSARGQTRARMEKSADSTWHARIEKKCYRYTTLAGDVRHWEQHQLAHAHDWRRVEIVAACVVANGPLPALDGDKANRLTQQFGKVNCKTCRTVLDIMLTRGEIDINDKKRTLPFVVKADPFPPLYQRCGMCGKNRETCGHFVGGGAL